MTLSTTVNMWLGIAFVFLAIVAVILQAWLWHYPMDPPNDPRGKSLAPRSWVNVHRTVGAGYVLIYVVLMTQMVPRLWQYQVELPARTVMHAVMGITVGCLLLAKFSIIRFFQWFGKSLPGIGLGILTCTIILATLSIPFAVRAHGFGKNLLDDDNRARVERVLAGIEWSDPKVDPKALATPRAIERGQKVLTTKCTACHDMRTILAKPRSGRGWHDVVERMAEKPSFGAAIKPEDVPFVTAYLVALTPDIQESMERKVADEKERAEAVAEVKVAMVEEPPATPTPPTSLPAPPPAKPPVDPLKYKAVFEEQCSQCHKLANVEKHGPDSQKGWREVVTRMIEENDADLTAAQARQIVLYLSATHGRN